jgi:WD40 repeat protein
LWIASLLSSATASAQPSAGRPNLHLETQPPTDDRSLDMMPRRGLPFVGAASPDGRLVAWGSGDRLVRLWSVEHQREVRALRGLTTRPEAIEFVDSGRKIMARDYEHAVVWSALTGAVFLTKESLGAPRMTVSANGRFVINDVRGRIDRQDGVTRAPDTHDLVSIGEVWDLEAERKITSVRLFEDAPTLSLSNDGRWLVQSDKRSLSLVDLGTGREQWRVAIEGPIARHVISGDGAWIAGVLANRVVVWRLTDGAPVANMEAATDQALSFLESSWLMLSGSGPIRLYELGSWRAGPVIPSGRHVAASADGRRLAVITSTPIGWRPDPDRVAPFIGDKPPDQPIMRQDVTVYSAPDFELSRSFEIPSYLWGAAVNADGRVLITGTGRGPLVFDLATGTQSSNGTRLIPELDAARAVAFDRTGDLAFVASGKDVVIWDLPRGSRRAVVFSHPERVMAIAPAHATSKLFTVAYDGVIREWDMDTGAINATHELGTELPWAMALSPDDETVAIASFEGFRVLRLPDWTPIVKKTYGTFGVAFSADGTRVAAAYEGGAVAFDPRTGRHIFGEPEKSAWCCMSRPIAYLPDGKHIVTATPNDGLLNLLDATDGRARLWLGGDYYGFSRSRTAIAVSRDGRYVFAGNGREPAIEVWDLRQPRPAVPWKRLDGHQALITSLAVHPNGRYLLSGAEDGSARIWDIESGQEAMTLVTFPDRRWIAVAPDGRFDGDLRGEDLPLHWTLDDDPMRPMGLASFMHDFYTPRLLATLVARDDRTPRPALATLNRAQPRVGITRVQWERSPVSLSVAVEVTQSSYRNQTSGAHDVRLFLDERIVAEREGPLTLDAEGRATVVFEGIQVPRGRKEIAFSAYAFNADGVRSEVAQRRIAVPLTAVAERRAYIVAIGINDVPRLPSLRLRFAADDARVMSETLSQSLRRQGRYASVDLTLLLSGVKKRQKERSGDVDVASRGVIEEEIGRIASEAQPEDLVIITFAGHGVTDANGALHLVPADAFPRADGVPARTISARDLADWLREIRAEDTVLILDACHAAASVDENGFKPTPSRDRGLGQLAYDARMRILAATQASTAAFELERFGRGVLTYALVDEGLAGRLADWRPADGRIQLSEWLEYAVRRVPDLFATAASPSSSNGPTTADPYAATSGNARGLRVSRSLQSPVLFDFVTRVTGDIVLTGRD